MTGRAHKSATIRRSWHTLQATALVNEAYLKIMGCDASEWQGRAHFLAICALVMLHILIDDARTQAHDKRGGVQVSLGEGGVHETRPLATY